VSFDGEKEARALWHRFGVANYADAYEAQAALVALLRRAFDAGVEATLARLKEAAAAPLPPSEPGR
jgi:hypothetical protein